MGENYFRVKDVILYIKIRKITKIGIFQDICRKFRSVNKRGPCCKIRRRRHRRGAHVEKSGAEGPPGYV